MKMRTGAILAAAGMCLALAGTGHPIGSALAQPGTRAADAATATVDVHDINFSGGTLGEYFDALAEITSANVVATGDVRALDMPPVRLRNVTSDAAVQMVASMFTDDMGPMIHIESVRDSASLDQQARQQPVTPQTQEQMAQLLRHRADTLRVQVYVVTARPRRDSSAPPPVNDVFSIGDVLRPSNEEPVDLQVERLFEMIDSAMRVSAGGQEAPQPPELAFHDETQMLVFRGSVEQHRMIESILHRYADSWRPLSGQARDLREEIGELTLEAETSAIEANAAMQRLEFARRGVEEMRQLVAAGSASQREMSDAILKLSDLEAQVQILEARAQYARQRAAARSESLAAIVQGDQPSPVIYDFRSLGARGDQVGLAFKALLDAAQLPGTRIEADGQGSVTLIAQPPIHEALRYLLSHLRQAARPGT